MRYTYRAHATPPPLPNGVLPLNYAAPTWSTSDSTLVGYGSWILATGSSSGVTIPLRLPDSRVDRYRLSVLLGGQAGITAGVVESLFTWRIQSPDFNYRPIQYSPFENPKVGGSQHVLASGPITDLSLYPGLALLFLACENLSAVDLYLIAVELELYG